MEKQTGSGSFSKHVGQKFGQKLGKKLGREISRKGEAIGQKFDAQVDQLGEKVTSVATTLKQTAADTAKTGIDQILLNLEHRGLNLKDKQEIIHRVSQTVLDRAEKIRSQIAENSPLGAYAPSWMKEPLVKTEEAVTAPAEAAGSMTEATVSEPALDMQPEILSGEAEEALEQSAENAQGEFPGAVVENSTETKSSKKKSTKSKSNRSSK